MIQNPKSLTEQLLNLAERIAIELRTVVKTVGTKISKKDADTAYLGKTAKAASAKIADSATKATQDSNGNVIVNTYATKTELTNGLADKLATTGKAQTAGIADTANALSSSAKVPYSQITGTPSIPDINKLIFRERNRGILAGYEATRPGTNVNAIASDTMFTSKNFIVQSGAATATEAWTKIVTMTGGSVTLDNNWSWANGSAPTLKYPGILVCHWDGGANHGIASYIPGVS